jgi:hypothetical protein
MTDWTAFDTIFTHLVDFWMGSTFVLAAVTVLGFWSILLSSGLRFQETFVLSLPVIAGLSTGGWLGSNQWSYYLILIVASLIYAFSIIKLLRR